MYLNRMKYVHLPDRNSSSSSGFITIVASSSCFLGIDNIYRHIPTHIFQSAMNCNGSMD